jgi:hypothetical protein
VVIAWFAILFSGRFPLGLRGFVIGWLRWSARVNAYWMSLRDEYPPFSMSADAAPLTGGRHALAGVAGLALVSAAATGVVLGLLASETTVEADVSFATLQDGSASETLEISDMEVTLVGAIDPYEFGDSLFLPEDDRRFLAFGVDLFNLSGASAEIAEGDFQLEDTSGDKHDPYLVSYQGLQGPRSLDEDEGARLIVIFEVPQDEAPEQFEYQPEFLQRARFNIE